MENLDYANYVITSITEVNFFEKKPELRQLRQLRITEAIFLKKNLNYVNYVITPITQLQKRQNHPLVLPLVRLELNLPLNENKQHHWKWLYWGIFGL